MESGKCGRIDFMKQIVVVGIGPGGVDCMTSCAARAIESADLVVGYEKYVELVKSLVAGTECFKNGMMGERERCLYALEQAALGKTVSLICSGDSGVYGMASLVLELGSDDDGVSVEIVPGVTAALSGAALLGSPLTGDFCVVSLSNLLTPQDKIERRLRAAVAGDFSIALYNPRSRNRPDTLRRAVSILRETLPDDTPAGWVRNVAREGEERCICSLSELGEAELDMFCTAFVGNSQTKIVERGGKKWLVTSRGYQL